jgi:hypothetical protein
MREAFDATGQCRSDVSRNAFAVVGAASRRDAPAVVGAGPDPHALAVRCASRTSTASTLRVRRRHATSEEFRAVARVTFSGHGARESHQRERHPGAAHCGLLPCVRVLGGRWSTIVLCLLRVPLRSQSPASPSMARRSAQCAEPLYKRRQAASMRPHCVLSASTDHRRSVAPTSTAARSWRAEATAKAPAGQRRKRTCSTNSEV